MSTVHQTPAAPKQVPVSYDFLREAGHIMNSGQSRSFMIVGEVNDSFYDHRQTLGGGTYVPLADLLRSRWSHENRLIITYKLNAPIQISGTKSAVEKLAEAWAFHVENMDPTRSESMEEEGVRKIRERKQRFRNELRSASKNTPAVLYFLKTLCEASRKAYECDPIFDGQLLIILERAEFLLPKGEIASLNDVDRARIGICLDWFSDPGFTSGDDIVVLISESRSLLNRKVSSLPQMLSVDVASPNEAQREHVIRWLAGSHLSQETTRKLAEWTAGLSTHILLQLLRSAKHRSEGSNENIWEVDKELINKKVEEFIEAQLGEGVVRFKRPTHTLKDLIGVSELKQYLRKKIIPRLKKGKLPGVTVCGPIGCGKTFIFEAVAAELGIPVLELKNIRSKWFGETDLIVDRLRRLLSALGRVAIFIDEADAKFSDLAAEQHATEKRVTGAIQEMMSDTKMRKRVIWLIMTARIHLMPPDMLRDGRVGNLVILVPDPTGTDKEDFIHWSIRSYIRAEDQELNDQTISQLDELIKGYSASNFQALREELEAEADDGKLSLDDVIEVIEDILPANIGEVREYQWMQSLLHCRRRSLLPDRKYEPEKWRERIAELEARGIR